MLLGIPEDCSDVTDAKVRNTFSPETLPFSISDVSATPHFCGFSYQQYRVAQK